MNSVNRLWIAFSQDPSVKHFRVKLASRIKIIRIIVIVIVIVIIIVHKKYLQASYLADVRLSATFFALWFLYSSSFFRIGCKENIDHFTSFYFLIMHARASRCYNNDTNKKVRQQPQRPLTQKQKQPTTANNNNNNNSYKNNISNRNKNKVSVCVMACTHVCMYVCILKSGNMASSLWKHIYDHKVRWRGPGKGGNSHILTK